jgi:hypothetical protein
MPVAGGEPKPSVVVLHPEHARPPTDTVMTFIAMMSHPLEQVPQKTSRRGFSWRPNADSILVTESGGWDGQTVQHGFA